MEFLYSAVYGGDGYPFHAIAKEVKGVQRPEELENPDSALIVWGGSDISPSLYNHPESTHTYPGGRRDFIEWALMKRAIEMGMPIIGICRGAQMACAAAGGFLIQDVRNHGSNHMVKTIDGDTIKVNSLHHQMMFPYQVEHKLLAWCENPRSVKQGDDGSLVSHYIYKDDQFYVPEEGFKEPELVYFPKIKALGIQWHPEMMTENALATKFIFNQMEEIGWL